MRMCLVQLDLRPEMGPGGFLDWVQTRILNEFLRYYIDSIGVRCNQSLHVSSAVAEKEIAIRISTNACSMMHLLEWTSIEKCQ
jgi:hypothetical protein